MQRNNSTIVLEIVNINKSEQKQIPSWSIPIALLSCVLLAFFDKISIAALFTDPQFQQAMGIGFDPTLLGFLMTIFLLSYGVSSIFLGGVGDYVNPRYLLIGMMAIWCVLMLLMGLTHSYKIMLLLRFLLGIAEGPLIPIAFMVIRHVFPAHFQARATMIWLLGTPFGAALGFPITLFILHHFGWQMTFFVMAALTLPAMAMIFYSLRRVNYEFDSQQKKVESSDIPHKPLNSHDYLKLIKHIPFWLTCCFNLAFLTYLWGMNGWLPSYLIEGKQVDIEQAGYLTSMPFIGMLLGEVLGAWFADSNEQRSVTCFCSIFGAAMGLILVLYLQNIHMIILAMCFSMFMWGIGAPNVFALLGKVADKRISAAAGGIFNGLGNFAGSLAPVIMGLLITFTNNMDSGLVFLVIVALFGSAALLPLLKKY